VAVRRRHGLKLGDQEFPTWVSSSALGTARPSLSAADDGVSAVADVLVIGGGPAGC